MSEARNAVWGLFLLGSLALGGCGMAGDESSDRAAGMAPNDYSADAANGGAGGGGSSTPEPEPEAQAPVSAPQAGLHYVFIADADLDALVRIDALTLEVTLVPVGNRPEVLAVLPGTDTVAVLSAGSDELSVVDAAKAEPDVISLPVPHGYNAISFGKKGGAAVAWFDAARAKAGEPLGPLQSVTLARLSEGDPETVDVTVGFEPHDVVFTADGATALVVTREGISLIDVATVKEDALVPAVAISDTPLAAAVEREVLVTRDGGTAVVRVLGEGRLLVLSLPDGELSPVPLPGEPTDLDLTPDGKTAVAVLKDTQQVALVALSGPKPPTDPDSLVVVDVPGAAMGLAHVTEDGRLALLSTSDSLVETIAMLDLESLDVSVFALQKSVNSITSTPDGRYALVVHQVVGPGTSYGTTSEQVDATVDSKPGYSVVDLEAGFAKLFLTDVPVASVAFAPEDDKVVLLLPGTSTVSHSAAVVRLGPLLEERLPLVSLPLFLVPVPTVHRMAIAEQHASGRVTFFDTASGKTSTVTGFELNALID